MYDIEFTPESLGDISEFRKFEQQTIFAEIKTQLSYQPTIETRNRKRLRPTEVSEWELRIDKIRVFYDVFEQIRIVKVEAVGRKEGNKLILRGKEYKL
ncbi:addiction module toxin RelE [Chloroflexi bacterium TSY]|nr:addiction module toxin RelE [Chloroflexi bacterium TSY]